MAEIPSSGTTYESKAEPQQSGSSYVQMWMDALSQAEREEKDWREGAEKAYETYRGKRKSNSRAFNIFHSNIETICPALYNSTPVPDVRRRYADDDPVGRVASDILERALSYSIDSYDFDEVIKTSLKDGEIAGRGIPRVRYVPTYGEPIRDGQGQPVVDGDGQPVNEVTYEEVTCDYVPWRYFRRGPGRTWKDVPWIAFGDFLSADALKEMNPTLAPSVPLNFSADASGDMKKAGDTPSIFKRALVWQIWDKESRKVISIASDYGADVLKVVNDPLGLGDFFPVPRPYQPILTTDSLVPITPYDIYEDLVLELNDITARIARLVKQLRPRGLYGGSSVDDLKAVSEGGDGELIPATSPEIFSATGGLSAIISWFPLEPTANALQQLVNQREIVKAAIFEVTGLSDIIRGSSKATETATAQNIKQQWGSLRIQDRQSEVARMCRDIFRIKAEIIATKFSWNTLSQMTGIRLPTQAAKQQAQTLLQQPQAGQPQTQAQPPGPQATPQAQQPQIPPDIAEMLQQPSVEDVMGLLQSDVMRSYRVDVESDSTIRGDLSRNQQQMNAFLQGTAEFARAMGPILQQYPALSHAVFEVYTAFSRQFRLGKQAEDALDNLADLAAKGAMQAQQTKPGDAKAQAENARSQAMLQQTQLEGQLSQQEFQQKSALLNQQQALNERKMALQERQLALKEARQAAKEAQARSLLQPVDPIQVAASNGSFPASVMPAQAAPPSIAMPQGPQ